MNNAIVKQIISFFFLMALQILVCNHIYAFGFINPNVYLLILLLLPITLPKSAQYAIGFTTGLIVDIFDLTLGIHAVASLILIAIRPWVIKLFSVNKIKTEETTPTPKTKDFSWLLYYTLFMVFIHQTLTNLLEIWSFNRFGMTLLSIGINTLFTTILILCVEYIFIPNKSNLNKSL